MISWVSHVDTWPNANMTDEQEQILRVHGEGIMVEVERTEDSRTFISFHRNEHGGLLMETSTCYGDIDGNEND